MSRAMRNSLRTLLLVAAALVVWDGSCFVYGFYNGVRAHRAFLTVQESWQRKDWSVLATDIEKTSALVGKTHRAFSLLVVAPHVPVYGKEVVALEQLGGAFRSLARGAETLAPLIQKIGPLSIAAASPNTVHATLARHELNATISGAIPLLDTAVHSFANAGVFLRRVPPHTRIMNVAQVQNAFEAAHTAIDFFERVEPLVSLLPAMMGFEGERTHLLLFQNDTELRPTGGFIGNYGILRMRNGMILDFKIDDTYNLDRAANVATRPNAPIPPAPFPLPEHLAQPLWFLRDVNWSPDFPETAARAINFYRDEGGTAVPNSVIALTTKPLIDVLRIFGPVVADGQQFTADNVVDVLQSAVELNYTARGLTDATRKTIVNSLGQALTKKIQTLSLWQWRDVLSVFEKNLEQKHILLYDTNTDVEREMIARNWAGELKQIDSDYLMVVDANLASLKTDPAVDRSIRYELTPDANGALIADLTIRYAHRGSFTWKTTRLRNYVRVYVPSGARLIRADGAMVREKNPKIGTVVQTTEHGKTVFGAFIAVEPGETKELHLQYALPDRVVHVRTNERRYDLYVQRQPGAAAHALTIIGPAIPTSAWSPSTLTAERKQNGSVVWKTPLSTDQSFSLVFPSKSP